MGTRELMRPFADRVEHALVQEPHAEAPVHVGPGGVVSSNHIAAGRPAPVGAHIVVSELAIDEIGIASLEAAFSDRLGEVDSFPGHLGLQVWRDNQQPGRYLMVTWWETEDAFRQYMQSDSHRCSHARIPSEPARPKAVRVSRFSLVTE